MKTRFDRIKKDNIYNMIDLPGRDYFKIEIVSKYGSSIERVYKYLHDKNVYGAAHLIEHLSFRETLDYSSSDFINVLKSNGTYNASTSYDRINYYYSTTTDYADLAIKLVHNAALNDLTKISEEEFQIEKNVVLNEAKRYYDDDQTMFYMNVDKVASRYDESDNIIGSIDSISNITLKDCIKIKEMLLSDSIEYNIIYDSTKSSMQDIIEKIEKEYSRYSKHFSNVSLLYNSMTKSPYKSGIIDCDSEQVMTCLIMNKVKNIITADYVNSYISNYAKDVSLNDVIREQNGLTYSMFFNASMYNYEFYNNFGCDVSKGTEDKLMELFSTSINYIYRTFSIADYNEFMRVNTLKRKMRYLDQRSYSEFFKYSLWTDLIPDTIEDLDLFFYELESKYCRFTDFINYLAEINEIVKNKTYLHISSINNIN